MNKIEIVTSHFLELAISKIPDLFMAIVTLLVGLWIIKKLGTIIQSRFHKNRVDVTLGEFLLSMIKVVFYVLLIISCASMIGIQTSSFVALLGAAGLAVGLALQGSLSNFAGGVLILLFKPFRIGHQITSSNNVSGLVMKIDILYTTLKAGNGTTIYAPNGPLANSVINNTTDNEIRQAEYKVKLSYNTNIDTVRKLILSILDLDSRILKTPAPAVLVSSLEDNAIVLLIRTWSKNDVFWAAYHSNFQLIKETLEVNEIQMAGAKTEIHVINEPASNS